MKPSETEQIYGEQCRSRRIAPQEDEGRAWHKYLRQYDAKDVRAALDAWSRDTTPTKDGTPRGKWLPAPVELVPVVERLLREKAARAAVPAFYVRWMCETCKIAKAGFLAHGDSDERTCCSSPMKIIVDERNRG